MLLAAAYLTGICVQAPASCPVAALSMPALLPLTIPEVRHLLARRVMAFFLVCMPGAGLVVVAQLSPR